MTLSVQKERFRHLVSGAILDLWKKETGSLASVLIEATVCITSCNSRVTVIQLSDHFPGLIPEPLPPPSVAEKTVQLRNNNNNNNNNNGPGRICHVVGQKRKLSGDDCRWDDNDDDDIQVMRGYRGVRSDHPPVGSSQQQHRLRMDSNNNQTFVAEDAGTNADDGEATDKNDSCEDSEEEGTSEDAEEDRPWHRPPHPPPLLGDPASGLFYRMIPDTGFHSTHARTENKNDKIPPGKRTTEDSAIQDMTTSSILINASLNDEDSANNESIPAQVRRRSHLFAGRRDVDLLLSAPQNYTDQVRDAIRSRLLNGKGVGGPTPPNSQSTPRGSLGPFDAVAAPAWSPIKRENQQGGTASAADGGLHPLPRPRFPPPSSSSASSPLDLVQLSRSLTGAAVSGTRHQPIPLQRIAGLGIGADSGGVFASGTSDPDERKGAGLFGLCGGQFSGQKIERFDVSCEDKATGCGDQKAYSCGFCQKTFLFKSKYHEHLPVHTSARPFECHMCTRTYKYKYDLRVHLRTHLGIPTKSTVCPFCSEKFATNKLLRSHMKETHREPRRLQVNEEQGTTAMESVPSMSPSSSSV